MKKAAAIFSKLLPIILLALVLLFITQAVYARAGGAGGGSSGGGGGGDDGDGIFDLVFDLIELMFYNPTLGVIGIMVVVLVGVFLRTRRND